jgi:hypothetical protein
MDVFQMRTKEAYPKRKKKEAINKNLNRWFFQKNVSKSLLYRSSHIRQIFNRMGFNDQEIVALSGAHALGRFGSYMTIELYIFRITLFFMLCSALMVFIDAMQPPVAMSGHGLPPRILLITFTSRYCLD